MTLYSILIVENMWIAFVKCAKFVDKEDYVYISGYLGDFIFKFNFLKFKILMKVTVIHKNMHDSQNTSLTVPNRWISIV